MRSDTAKSPTIMTPATFQTCALPLPQLVRLLSRRRLQDLPCCQSTRRSRENAVKGDVLTSGPDAINSESTPATPRVQRIVPMLVKEAVTQQVLNKYYWNFPASTRVVINTRTEEKAHRLRCGLLLADTSKINKSSLLLQEGANDKKNKNTTHKVSTDN